MVDFIEEQIFRFQLTCLTCDYRQYYLSHRWLRARLQYLQCFSNGYIAVLHWAIDIRYSRVVCIIPPSLVAEGIMFSGCSSLSSSAAELWDFSFKPSDRSGPIFSMLLYPKDRRYGYVYWLQKWYNFGDALLVLLIWIQLLLRETTKNSCQWGSKLYLRRVAYNSVGSFLLFI